MSNPTSDLLLRSLATGSLAAVLLIPRGAVAAPTLKQCIVDYIVPGNDGAVDSRIIFARDAFGVRAVTGDAGTVFPQTVIEASGEIDVSQLPMVLKRSTGLPIDMLATIVGVTKVTYHKWLRGGGIADDSHQRLKELADILPTLQYIRPNLREFLKTSQGIVSPMQLLIDRKDVAVVGLALRGGPAISLETPSAKTGLRQVRPLGNRRRLNREALERFAPRAVAEIETEPLEHESDIDPATVGFGLFV